MNYNSIKCQFDDCGLILENPIRLVCGNNICYNHLFGLETKFKCFCCPKQHSLPDKGFVINDEIEEMIKNFNQSDPLRMQIDESLHQISDLSNNYDKINLNIYIENYFNEIKNKVDLHREELIKEITERSEEMIRKLKEKENKCKSNAVKLIKINLNLEIVDISLQEMRRLDINRNELIEILDELNENKQNIETQIEQLKNDLLLGEIIEFNKTERNSSFGELIIKNNDFVLSEKCRKLIQTFNQHTDTVRSIQVDEKSNKLITSSDDMTIKIWNLETGECLKTLNNQHKNWITSVLMIQNSKFISGSWDKTIKLWDLNSFECLNTLTNDSGVYSLCLLPNNKIVCGCVNGTITIWNVDNSSKGKTFKAHDKMIPHLLLADKTKLISCSYDKTIKIWNIEQFECIKVLVGHSDIIRSIDLTTNGNLLSCSSDKTIKLWQIETGKELKSFKFSYPVLCLKTLSDDLIAVAFHNDQILIYNINEMKLIKSISTHSPSIYSLFVLSNGNMVSGAGDGELKYWKLFI